MRSLPYVPLWQQAVDRVLTMFQAGAPSWDAAGPQPTLFCETPVGGGVDAPHYAWLADTTRTLLPQMVQSGVATAEAVAIETLESRLRSAVVEARSQVDVPAQVCAWTSI